MPMPKSPRILKPICFDVIAVVMVDVRGFRSNLFERDLDRTGEASEKEGLLEKPRSLMPTYRHTRRPQGHRAFWLKCEK
jgi:hypothetical protein